MSRLRTVEPNGRGINRETFTWLFRHIHQVSPAGKPITVVMSQIQVEIDALLAQATALTEKAPPPSPPRPVKTRTAQSTACGRHPSREVEEPARMLRLQVPVIVRLAERTMPIEDIINLSTGAIIEFDKPAEAELDLMINNKCIGMGQAVKVGENFGLRISTIGSIRDRIQALGPPSAAQPTILRK